ncbi:hypothetical protein SK854_18240 [Lentzea sp. BCCO 10_0061]|uniref:Uncharacterized protein n=1 Tax=Lentzea sokolovensis TaxID=3095429 RepID=A0ABU4UYM0_9PSEU|nr:hypothetical protein [Lentzea sp. BCCO 10_0061]MDX8144064.1 hypothetical protein [Lentzea sp. BCCO 10_0061]
MTVTAPQRTTIVPAVTLLQAGAGLLAVYAYLIGQHFDLAVIRAVLNRPLGLGEDFGPLALLVLLATTGYTATFDRSPLVSRLQRTYLPAGIAVGLAAALVTFGVPIWTSPDTAGTSLLDFAGNLSLVSQLVTNAPLLVPLAWVVLLQLVGVATAELTRRFGVVVPIAQIIVVTVVVAVAPTSRAALVLVFYPLVIFGQVIALHSRGVIPTWIASGIAMLCAIPVLGLNNTNEQFAQWWYPVASLIAALLVAVAVVVSGETARRLAGHAAVRWLADHAIWLVVLAGVIGYPLLGGAP